MRPLKKVLLTVPLAQLRQRRHEKPLRPPPLRTEILTQHPEDQLKREEQTEPPFPEFEPESLQRLLQRIIKDKP